MRTVSRPYPGSCPDRFLASDWRDTNCLRLPGDDSSDDDFGPALPSEVAPKKKRRKLPFENIYVNALPVSAKYSKSLMHKDQLSFITVAPYTDFVITSSVDGFVKFWKKMAEGIEFVKEFRAHPGEIRSATVSADGRSFATTGLDKTVKIFDVITFGTLSVRFVIY
jgi:peptidylprolyl isomerase domain and WD repeat-containing protein 1